MVSWHGMVVHFMARHCTYACMPACQLAFLPFRLPACLHAYLPACLPASLHARVYACVRACMRACVRACVRPPVSACVCLCVCVCPESVHAYSRSCVDIHGHTRFYVHACMFSHTHLCMSAHHGPHLYANLSEEHSLQKIRTSMHWAPKRKGLQSCFRCGRLGQIMILQGNLSCPTIPLFLMCICISF